MEKERIQCFYVDKSGGKEALERKLRTLRAEGFEILPCQGDTDEMACDHIEIEPGWIIITAVRPEISLGTPKSGDLLQEDKK